MKDYTHLVGHEFPGGRYTLPEYLSWLWADVVCAEPSSAVAHPSLGYFVALRGCGATIQDIFDLLDADAASGVLFGEQILELAGTLKPGATYEVRGKIVEVVRKEGKRAGVFDRLTFTITVREESETEPVIVSTSTWIFPRGEST